MPPFPPAVSGKVAPAPCSKGQRPVKIEACDGSVQGEVEYALG